VLILEVLIWVDQVSISFLITLPSLHKRQTLPVSLQGSSSYVQSRGSAWGYFSLQVY
jgi:hypothetical protein